MNIPKGLENVLSIDPDVMHGDVCFAGTRVPVTVLLDNLSEGMGIEEFSKYYPSVKRAHVEAVMEWEHNQIREALGLKKAS